MVNSRVLKRHCLALGAALLLLGLIGCSGSPEEAGTVSPSPSRTRIPALTFAFGIGGKNVLDTKRGTFTKDMILDPPFTVPMWLSAAEMDRIATKIEEVDFFSYPSVFAPEGQPGDRFPPAGMEPTYRFEVETEAGTKSVEWKVEVYPRGGQAVGLFEPAGGVRSGRLCKARPPAGLLPAGGLACVLGASRAGYFTLNVRHFVLAAVCSALLAIVARMR